MAIFVFSWPAFTMLEDGGRKSDRFNAMSATAAPRKHCLMSKAVEGRSGSSDLRGLDGGFQLLIGECPD